MSVVEEVESPKLCRSKAKNSAERTQKLRLARKLKMIASVSLHSWPAKKRDVVDAASTQ